MREMKGALTLAAITWLIGGTWAVADQLSTTTTETQTQTEMPVQQQIIHEKEEVPVPVPVPVEVPAPQQHTSSSSSTTQSSKEIVKKVEPATTKKTTCHKQISYRPPARPVAKKCATSTAKSQGKEEVIEKKENYSHQESNSNDAQ